MLLEASGSLTSSYMIKAAKEAKIKVVASDIEECAASFLADEFVLFPRFRDPQLWEKMEKEILARGINVVVPSFDETLLTWSEKKKYFKNKGVDVILSDEKSIAICQDKWKTFQFFEAHEIPTPKTSLENKYPVVKPRLGRGGKDILINNNGKQVEMEGMVSQEFLSGTEYTIDVFCNNSGEPIYIIPRKRLAVKDGKSIHGITVDHKKITEWVKRICGATHFIGPINMQCFEESNGDIKFTEINPRIAGGMALGFAASENWVPLIINHTIGGKPISPKTIQYGLKMYRFYDEVFVD
jgi:carbamoyl-phosphate synthase large subunit